MMTHPEHGEAGPVTRHAFDRVWAARGWTLVNGEKKTTARRGRAQTTKEQE